MESNVTDRGKRTKGETEPTQLGPAEEAIHAKSPEPEAKNVAAIEKDMQSDMTGAGGEAWGELLEVSPWAKRTEPFAAVDVSEAPPPGPTRPTSRAGSALGRSGSNFENPWADTVGAARSEEEALRSGAPASLERAPTDERATESGAQEQPVREAIELSDAARPAVGAVEESAGGEAVTGDIEHEPVERPVTVAARGGVTEVKKEKGTAKPTATETQDHKDSRGATKASGKASPAAGWFSNGKWTPPSKVAVSGPKEEALPQAEQQEAAIGQTAAEAPAEKEEAAVQETVTEGSEGEGEAETPATEALADTFLKEREAPKAETVAERKPTEAAAVEVPLVAIPVEGLADGVVTALGNGLGHVLGASWRAASWIALGARAGMNAVGGLLSRVKPGSKSARKAVENRPR